MDVSSNVGTNNGLILGRNISSNVCSNAGSNVGSYVGSNVGLKIGLNVVTVKAVLFLLRNTSVSVCLRLCFFAMTIIKNVRFYFCC